MLAFYDDKRSSAVFQDSKELRKMFGNIMKPIIRRITDSLTEQRKNWTRDDYKAYAKSDKAPNILKKVERDIYENAVLLHAVCNKKFNNTKTDLWSMDIVEDIVNAFPETFFMIQFYRMDQFLTETIKGMIRDSIKKMNTTTIAMSPNQNQGSKNCQRTDGCCFDWFYAFLLMPFEINKYPMGNLGFGTYLMYFGRFRFSKGGKYDFLGNKKLRAPEEELTRNILIDVLKGLDLNSKETNISTYELVKLLHADEESWQDGPPWKFVQYLQSAYGCSDKFELLSLKESWTTYIKRNTEFKSPCKNKQFYKDSIKSKEKQKHFDKCCQMFQLIQDFKLPQILKLMKYSTQPATFTEPLKDFLDSYDNLDFLPFKNLSNHKSNKDLYKLMERNVNPRILKCQYAGKGRLWPEYCNLFHFSMTNDGFGYTFNNANFWDIFTQTNYTETYANIMRPKGFKEDQSIQSFDDIYPSKGIRFPLLSGPSGRLQVFNYPLSGR